MRRWRWRTEVRGWRYSGGDIAVLAGDLHHPAEPRLLGPPHEEEHGQVSEEEDADPVWHGVGPGPSEVPVDDDHGDEDGDRVHDEGKKQVFSDERQHQRGRGKDL